MCADVVYVGVIHPYHLSTSLLFMNAKKNVLCEKPLAMNSREVQQIVASAKMNDVFLMEVWMEQTNKKTFTSWFLFLISLTLFSHAYSEQYDHCHPCFKDAGCFEMWQLEDDLHYLYISE